MTMKKTYSLLLISSFLLIISTSLTPAPQGEQLLDNFDEYASQKQFSRIWSAWEEGAMVDLRLEDSAASGHGKVMVVEMLSLSEGEQPNIGSVFALLHGPDRHWQDGMGIRLWLDNGGGDDLFLSLNFKEQYNEFWATVHGSPVFLQPEGGRIQQRQIEYGNIPIPAGFSGTITIPFTSFTVPDWNTANGNQEINLRTIESLGFAVMAQDALPFSFAIDDIEVITETFDNVLTITGLNYIYLPESGARLETYSATLTSLVDGNTTNPQVTWTVVSPQDESVQISKTGQLILQHDIQDSEVVIAASYQSPYGPVSTEFEVLLGGEGKPEENLDALKEMPPDEMLSQAEPTELDKISETYTSWLENYRLITVLASVMAILVIVFVFAYIELKLR